MFYYTEYISQMGKLTMASDGTNIVGLWLDGQKYFLDTLPETPNPKEDLDVFEKTHNWLDRYFAGKMPEISELPLNPIGLISVVVGLIIFFSEKGVEENRKIIGKKWIWFILFL